MEAVVFSSFGGPEVLRLVRLPTPEPGPGEVRVRVRAAGVQPVDLMVRGGRAPMGVPLAFPQQLGNEFAGVVDRVGAGVAGVAVGDEVLGFTLLRAYAQQVVVPADQVVAKPAGMSWEVAGGFSGAAQTAHAALRELRVGAGDTVLVHAAAGAVGTVAVQLARAWGATPIGTASPANHDHLLALGAIPVSYGDGLVDRVRTLAPNGVSAVLDAAGRGALRDSVRLGVDPDRVGTLVEADLAAELGVRRIRPERSAARLAELVAAHTAGDLVVHVRRGYPLAEAARAHQDVGTGHGRGKVVLVVE